MAFPSPAWKRVVNKQFSGKEVCSLQRCSGNLTLNNTDISFPTGGNSFIILKRSPVCARLFYSPDLWAGLPLSFLHFSNWRGKAGRAGAFFFFFFFPLSHFPAVFWTAFLQTSYSPWGIVSAWRDWMIVLIHKGLESDSKQGTQRKLHSQVKQWAQRSVESFFPSLTSWLPREECFPVVSLKWNFPDNSPV